MFREHTDDGAFGRPPRGLVDEGRDKSVLCALCSGNAGVADLDISHAFAKRKQEGSEKEEKSLYESLDILHPVYIEIVGVGWSHVQKMRSGSSFKRG